MKAVWVDVGKNLSIFVEYFTTLSKEQFCGDVFCQTNVLNCLTTGQSPVETKAVTE